MTDYVPEASYEGPLYTHPPADEQMKRDAELFRWLIAQGKPAVEYLALCAPQEWRERIYKAMLAAAPKPEAKPVAWLVRFSDGSICDNVSFESNGQVSAFIRQRIGEGKEWFYGAQALAVYTHPPADEQMKRDAERLDLLSELVEEAHVSSCFELDGGVHLTIEAPSSEPIAIREANNLRDAIDKYAALKAERGG